MMDFLKSNPHVTKDAYMWEWTVPQINLASLDFTHMIDVGEKQEVKSIDSGDDLLNDLGFTEEQKQSIYGKKG